MKINDEGKKFAKSKDVLEKIEINGTSNCFTMLKDHKDDFANNPTTRLINPAKNEVGRLSKKILGKVNCKLRNVLHLNQWKNTESVIEWFKRLKHKSQHKFVVFDIKDFYPSIKQNLLTMH